ncbi:hypothetical protein Bbelb_222610 [Branchiostoma belcheri]|nr:hypothetical protein Bbelb_222610 [Branchiostoma belcheri]
MHQVIGNTVRLRVLAQVQDCAADRHALEFRQGNWRKTEKLKVPLTKTTERRHKIGGMSGLEPGTSLFRVAHSAATPHDLTSVVREHMIGGMSGMSGLEPGTSWFRVEHAVATPHARPHGFSNQ